jgi:hypothetical protein
MRQKYQEQSFQPHDPQREQKARNDERNPGLREWLGGVVVDLARTVGENGNHIAMVCGIVALQSPPNSLPQNLAYGGMVTGIVINYVTNVLDAAFAEEREVEEPFQGYSRFGSNTSNNTEATIPHTQQPTADYEDITVAYQPLAAEHFDKPEKTYAAGYQAAVQAPTE